MDQSKSLLAGEAARNTNTTPTKNIVDTMIAAGHFTTFASAVKAAGLTDELAAKGPFTVFAPTDEAFKKLPAGGYDSVLRDVGKLKAVLNYHVVSGYFAARDVKSGAVMTLQGSPLTAAGSSSAVRGDGARVSKTSNVAAEGDVRVTQC